MTYFNKHYQTLLFPFIWLLITAVLQYLGKLNFRYEHGVLQNLELWRLFTAHWVHLNWTHWLLNNSGLILLVLIFQIKWTISFWFKVIIIQSIAISVMFLIFNDLLKWYVGFSGVLYGLYILASFLSFKKDKMMSLVVMLIVFTKIIAEQFFGSEISAQQLLGAPVIIDAHAYGVLCGLFLGILYKASIIKK